MTSSPCSPVRIATRGSRLAVWQAETVARLLKIPCEFIRIRTTGDTQRNEALQGVSQTGFFTREVEAAVLDGRADIAVHSLKDLPTTDTPGTILGAFLPRGPVSDLLLVHPGWHAFPAGPGEFLPVKSGCRIGAGSLRRQSLVRLYHPGIHPDLIRGNVPTRVQKCISETYGATVMARAGLDRLQLPLAPLAVYELDPAIWLPAPGQGIVAVQCRSDREDFLDLLSRIDDAHSRTAAAIERALLARFEGGCHTAFGAHAEPLDTPSTWRVSVGMDRPDLGWGAVAWTGTPAELVAHGPRDLPLFEPRIIERTEDLCCAVRQ